MCRKKRLVVVPGPGAIPEKNEGTAGSQWEYRFTVRADTRFQEDLI
jgi:hypothetical protein